MTKLTSTDFPAHAAALTEAQARTDFNAHVIIASVTLGMTDRAEIVAYAIKRFEDDAAKRRTYSGPKAKADAARSEAAALALRSIVEAVETYIVTDRAHGLIQWEGAAASEEDAMIRFDVEVGFFPAGVPADWAEHYEARRVLGA